MGRHIKKSVRDIILNPGPLHPLILDWYGGILLRNTPEFYFEYENFEVVGTQVHKKACTIRVYETRTSAFFRVSIFGYWVEDKVRNGPDPRPGRKLKRPILKRDQKKKGILVVHLPPQHVGETVFSPSSPQALASGKKTDESRLVFEVPTDWLKNSADRLLSSLLSENRYVDLPLIVHPRAKALLAGGLDAQLKQSFSITDLSDLETINPEEAERAFGSNFSFPISDDINDLEDLVTSLDVFEGLILSSNENGRFFSPDGKINSKDIKPPDLLYKFPLWSLRLDKIGRESVRALWSHRFNLTEGLPKQTDIQRLNSDNECIDHKRGPTDTLSTKHHWDIVGQTSIYGLPGLRPIKDKENQTDDILDAPRANVEKPNYIIGYIQPDKSDPSDPRKDFGIVIPSTFNRANINLTSLGATTALEWKGEPAKLRLLDNTDKNQLSHLTFDLERLSIQTALGRNVEIIAVSKGYLFPLGIRASYVEVHDRQIKKVGGIFVSRVEKKKFIVCPPTGKNGNVSRVFPGPYHPYDSRDFPVETVSMVTTVTPPLDDGLKNIPLPALKQYLSENSEVTIKACGTKDKSGLLFWPLVGKKNFVFEWRTKTAPSVKCSLIFVANSIADQPSIIRELKYYYDQTFDFLEGGELTTNIPDIEPLDLNAPERKAEFFGARQQHAPAPYRKPGRTSFDTDHWVLGVRGRRDIATPEGENYTVDGRMEGADQPPFYPCVRQSKIAIQSLDLLMGAPQGFTNVDFYQSYLERGFPEKEVAKNAEIYLKLKSSNLGVVTETQSDRLGGIASPDMQVAAISRKIGLVGGTPSTKKTLISDSSPAFDFSKAEEGKFDPKEFFGDIKLLGVLNLSDILNIDAGSGDEHLDIEVAPKLLQEIEYAFGNLTQEAAFQAASALKKLKGEIFGTDKLRDTINRNIMKIKIGKLTFADLYPDLNIAWTPFKPGLNSENFEGTLNSLITFLEANKPVSAKIPADILHDQGKILIRAIERLIDDPVPEKIKNKIEEIEGLFQLLKNYEKIFDNIRDQFIERFCSFVCETIKVEKLGPVLFGPNYDAAECQTLCKTPDRLLSGLRDGLYGRFFGEVFKELESFVNYVAISSKRLAFTYRDIQEIIFRSLENTIGNTENIEVITAEELEPVINLSHSMFEKIENRLLTLASESSSPRKFLNSVERDMEMLINEDIEEVVALVKENAVRFTKTSATAFSEFKEKLQTELKTAFASQLSTLEADAKKWLEAKLSKKLEPLILKALNGLIKMVDWATIIEAGQAISDWCDDAGIVVKQIGGALNIASAEVTPILKKIESAAETISQAQGVPDEAVNISKDVTASCAAISLHHGKLVHQFSELSKVKGNICTNAAGYLTPFTALLSLQKEIVFEVSKVSQKTMSLADVTGVDLTELEALTSSTIEAFKVLTKPVADAPTVWFKAIFEKIETLKDKLEPQYEKINKTITAASDNFDELYKELNKAEPNLNNLNRYSKAFLDSLKDDLTEDILCTVGLTPATISNLKTTVSHTITPVIETLQKFYACSVGALGELDEQNDELLQLLLASKFSKKKLQAALEIDVENLKDARAKLDKADFKAFISAFEKYKDRTTSSTGAFTLISSFIEDLIAMFRDGEFGQYFSNLIKNELELLESEIRSLIRYFTPTRLSTSYQWGTNISNKKLKDYGLEFLSSTAKQPLKKGSKTLELDAKATYDVIENELSSRIEGSLHPFELELIPGFPLKLATIKFAHERKTIDETGNEVSYWSGAHFVSENGGKPKFTIKVDNVNLEDGLKFLKALEAWMSPEGSGFYIRPWNGLRGIEAGYVFDVGLVQLGSLQFIDINLQIAAILKFTGEEAEFKFGLGSRNRPFLVANPPYGGGGWIILIANGDGKIESFDLSFGFGGVSAVKFGPLKAYGRILAGFWIRKSGDNGMVLTAFFEAAGGASIGCFSLSILIRLQLTQDPNRGVMEGSATFKFTFKVGWVKIKYKVKANYEVKGGGGGGTLTFNASSSYDYISTNVPDKEKNWNAYRQAIDTDLLA